jgi:hypothetical protein
VCALALMANSEDFFILGNSFLRGYYSIFDMLDGQLGFIPHATSTKEFPFAGANPSRSLNEASEQSVWTWIIVSILTLGWALFVGLYFFDYLKLTFDETWSIAINGLATTVFAVVVYLVLLPYLNEVFNGSPSIKKVDPNAIDLMRTGLLSLVFLGGASAALRKGCATKVS